LHEDLSAAADALTEGRYGELLVLAEGLERRAGGMAGLAPLLAREGGAREQALALRARLTTLSEMLAHVTTVRRALVELDPRSAGGYGPDGTRAAPAAASIRREV
jgi:hypothetical protein